MKIYVISLKDSIIRRESITKIFRSLSLEFEFFDAVKPLNYSDVVTYDAKFRQDFFGRDLQLGEIGCYLSHQKLWAVGVKENEPICIMEDDVIFAADIKTILATLESYNNYDIIKLGGIFPRKNFLWENFSGIKLVKYWFDNMGTQGYIIKPYAAKKLLKISVKIQVPVDDLLAQYNKHKLNILAVDPLPLTHRNDIPSELGDRKIKIKRNLYNKVLKAIAVELNRTLSFMLQLKYFIKSYKN